MIGRRNFVAAVDIVIVLMQKQLHGIDIQPAQTLVRLVVCAVKDIGKRRTDGAGLRLRALRL